jgi:hypothetical protein
MGGATRGRDDCKMLSGLRPRYVLGIVLCIDLIFIGILTRQKQNSPATREGCWRCRWGMVAVET